MAAPIEENHKESKPIIEFTTDVSIFLYPELRKMVYQIIRDLDKFQVFICCL